MPKLVHIKNKSLIIVSAILFIGVILSCSRFLFPLDSVSLEESYLQQCSYLDMNIVNIKENDGIPFWSFHFGGGYPFLKHPENISFSPLFYILVLPFGSAIGMKLMILFSYLIGITGMLLFCRKIMKYNVISSFIATGSFIFCSFIPFQISTGNTRDPWWLSLPLLLYLLEKSKKRFIWIFLCSATVVLLIFTGFNLYLAPLFLFMFLYALIRDLSRTGVNKTSRNRDLLTLRFMVILLLIFLLGAVKLIPVFELLKNNSRTITQYSMVRAGAMDIHTFFKALLVRGPFILPNSYAMNPSGLNIGCVFYFGYIPLVLFITSTVFCFKRTWQYLVLFCLFITICMADNSPVDLLYILWNLPIFSSIYQSARYFAFPAIFCFSVITGAIFNAGIFQRIYLPWKRILYLLAFLGLLNMAFTTESYYNMTKKFQIKPLPWNWRSSVFFNVRDILPEKPLRVAKAEIDLTAQKAQIVERTLGIQYFLLRQNIGLINWFGNLSLPENATEKYRVLVGRGTYWKDLRSDPTPKNGVLKNDLYHGESYFKSDPGRNKVLGITWKANKIIVAIDQSTPDTLIINQNYDKDWTTNTGELENINGLLGVKLDSPVAGKIILTYFPSSLLYGAGLSFITLILCLIFLIKERLALQKKTES